MSKRFRLVRVGIAQDKVVQHLVEGNPIYGDAQWFHPGEVRFAPFAGLIDLMQENLIARPFAGSRPKYAQPCYSFFNNDTISSSQFFLLRSMPLIRPLWSTTTAVG
jgi:hypothetical protein